MMYPSVAHGLLASGEPWIATASFAASFLTAAAQAVHFADATQQSTTRSALPAALQSLPLPGLVDELAERRFVPAALRRYSDAGPEPQRFGLHAVCMGVCNFLLCSVQQILGFMSHRRNDIISISNHTCMLIRINPMRNLTQLLMLMQVNL